MNVLFNEWIKKEEALDPEFIVIKKELLTCLHSKFEILTYRETILINIIFDEEQTLKEIDPRYQCSRARSRMIVRHALYRIRKEIQKDPALSKNDLFDLLSDITAHRLRR